MKVKKYQAKNRSSAMQMIKKEFGSDAVILQSRAIKKGGFLGLFQQNYVEVIAALDEEIPEENQSNAAEPIIQEPLTEQQTSESQIMKEIKELKVLMNRSTTASTSFPPLYDYAYQYLIRQEVDDNIAERWIENIVASSLNHELTLDEVERALFQQIEQELNNVLREKSTNPKKIIQFVGPTGVGKTTTLAKIATTFALQENKKIAFITLDTYRIAAAEQLKTYATILNVPIEVAYSLEDYQRALENFSQFDAVFVDTAGRNYREVAYMNELKQLISIKKQEVTTFLILSLTAKQEDITDIYHHFKAIPIEKIIFTKADETYAYGSIVNMALQEQKDIQFLTNGQEVPDDVLLPTGNLIAQKLLRRFKNE